jgi:hypothetical protein
MLWAIGQVALKNGGYVSAILRGEAGSVSDFFLTLIYIFSIYFIRKNNFELIRIVVV